MNDDYLRNAIVTDVYDGDTITVDIDLGFDVWIRKQKMRMVRIDTPELRGSGEKEKQLARDVRDWLSDLVLNKKVFIQSIRRDSFGRILGELWATYKGRTVNINQLMIDNHLCLEYHNTSEFKDRWSLDWFEKNKLQYLEFTKSN